MVELPTLKITGSGSFTIPELGHGKIAGSGRISPEKIKISGSGNLPGGIEVPRLRKSGSLKINGDLTAKEMECSGSTKVYGDLTIGYLKNSGSLAVEGILTGDTMKTSGSTRIEGDIKLTDKLDTSGSIETGGDLHASNHIDLTGAFYISGKISTKEFKASLHRSRSRVENGIEAERIEIKRKKGGREWMPDMREGELITTDLVSKEVSLENVTCDNIHGEKVIIGSGCRIRGRILYTHDIEIHENSQISNPPEKVDCI